MRQAKGPLRRVIAYKRVLIIPPAPPPRVPDDPGRLITIVEAPLPAYGWEDELECGHLLRPAADIFGERVPTRRRCYKCWREGRR